MAMASGTRVSHKLDGIGVRIIRTLPSVTYDLMKIRKEPAKAEVRR